jgi:hypothetical protein
MRANLVRLRQKSLAAQPKVAARVKRPPKPFVVTQGE